MDDFRALPELSEELQKMLARGEARLATVVAAYGGDVDVSIWDGSVARFASTAANLPVGQKGVLIQGFGDSKIFVPLGLEGKINRISDLSVLDVWQPSEIHIATGLTLANPTSGRATVSVNESVIASRAYLAANHWNIADVNYMHGTQHKTAYARVDDFYWVFTGPGLQTLWNVEAGIGGLLPNASYRYVVTVSFQTSWEAHGGHFQAGVRTWHGSGPSYDDIPTMDAEYSKDPQHWMSFTFERILNATADGTLIFYPTFSWIDGTVRIRSAKIVCQAIRNY